MFDQWAKNIQDTNTAGLTQAPVFNNYASSMYDNNKGNEAVGLAKITDINDQSQKAYDEKMRAIAQDEAKAAANKKIDELDPKNFTMKPSEDGGFNFADGAGKGISINDFAKATGSRPEELLKDSQNPNDQKFVRDHAVVTGLVNAMVNQDSRAIGIMRSQYITTDEAGNTVDPIGSMIEQYKNKSPGDLIKDFRAHWGTMYGGNNTTNSQGTTDRVIGDPRLAENQISDAQKAAIGTSSYDQVTAPLSNTAKDPGWWGGLARNSMNLTRTMIPGYGRAAGGAVDTVSSKYNAANDIWNQEKKKRESNPWLTATLGGK